MTVVLHAAARGCSSACPGLSAPSPILLLVGSSRIGSDSVRSAAFSPAALACAPSQSFWCIRNLPPCDCHGAAPSIHGPAPAVPGVPLASIPGCTAPRRSASSPAGLSRPKAREAESTSVKGTGLVSIVVLLGALWLFFFELPSEGHPVEMARTAAINVVAIVEIGCLFNCRSLYRIGAFKNRAFSAGTFVIVEIEKRPRRSKTESR